MAVPSFCDFSVVRSYRVIVTGALECKLPPEYITKLKMIKHNGKVSDFMSLDDLDDYVSEEES